MSSSGNRWAVCKSAPRSRQITTPAPHRSVFYRPYALPAAQPTVSKHCLGNAHQNKLVLSSAELLVVFCQLSLLHCWVGCEMQICGFQAKYTSELQAYLQATGLKASDLVKPRSRKGRVQVKPSAPATVQVCQAGLDDAVRAALPHFSQVWSGSTQQVPADHSVSQVTYSTASALPLNTAYR